MNRFDKWMVIEATALLVLITASIAWAVFQWGECRDMGFGFWYCVQHIA
jgi:hypothetical protein